MLKFIGGICIAIVTGWVIRDAAKSWRTQRLMRQVERDIARARRERAEALRWN